MIQKFDDRHSPVCRYDFEQLPVLDQSANGLHLSGGSGAVVRPVYERAVGLSPSGIWNRNGVSDALPRDYDGLTVNLLLVLRATPSGIFAASYSASGEAESTNYVWSIQIVSQQSLAFFTEHGAGLDAVYTASPAGKGLPALGVPFLLTLRVRAVTGGVVAQFFVDGEAFGDPSPTLAASTGGTASQLRINEAGSSALDYLGFELIGTDLTDTEIKRVYEYTLGPDFGTVDPAVQSLIVGALATDGATVVAKLTQASDSVRLVVTGPSATYYSDYGETDGNVVKLVVDGLDDDTAYTYEIEADGAILAGPTGAFRTLPSGNASFLIAFAGDAVSASNHVIFDTIRGKNPLCFLHLGDASYNDPSVNNPALFHANYDQMLAQSRQAALYRSVGFVHVWDDHDYGPNDSDASSPSRAASAAVYRLREPHYPLADSVSIYQTFDIGRVRFLVTDQRSAASAKSATDNSSKTVLGTTQKAWLKNLLSNSSGMLLVWVCPRWFGGVATAGADHWGGFTTERTELADYIHAHCPGRVVVLSADLHALGLDDGSHHDFATGGGEPLRTFQAAPLEIAAPNGGGMTYTSGPFTGNDQFGTMEVTDSGGSSLAVVWRGFNAGGTELASMSFTIPL